MFDIKKTTRDYWVPEGYRDEPKELQPKIWFRIPDAKESQLYDLAAAKIRSENEGSEDFMSYLGLPAALELMISTTLEFVVSVENFAYGGEAIVWSDEWFEQHSITKREFISMLGDTSKRRFFGLVDLCSSIIVGGVTAAQKKSLSAISGSGSDPITTAASASSAAESMTADSNSALECTTGDDTEANQESTTSVVSATDAKPSEPK